MKQLSLITAILFYVLNLFPQGVKTTSSGMGAIMRDAPSITGNTVINIPGYDTIYVVEYISDNYYKVVYHESVGYISYSNIVMNKSVEDLLVNKIIKDDPKMAHYIRTFGIANAKKIRDGKIWTGMTRYMAIKSIGSPKSKNVDRYSSGTHEQWVYGEDSKYKYLYFENDKLTSYSK
jgi:hypothetical protein